MKAQKKAREDYKKPGKKAALEKPIKITTMVNEELYKIIEQDVIKKNTSFSVLLRNMLAKKYGKEMSGN